MNDVTKIHEEKLTLVVDVNIPGHDVRVTTALFTRTRKQLVEREKGRCFISGMTAEESGHPLEAHHHPIERSLAEMIDWTLFMNDCLKGIWGIPAMKFDWEHFWKGAKSGEPPLDPYVFVDDMTVNGVLLAKQFHTGKNEGVHFMPLPFWIAQKYGKEGYQFTSTEVIHHSQEGAAK